MIPTIRKFRNTPLYANQWLNYENLGGCNENHNCSINIIENDNNYIIELAVPGYAKDELKVSTDKNLLTVASELPEENKEESKNYLRNEFFKKAFSRTFRLPQNSNTNEINASHNKGVLSIIVAKTAKVEIPVKDIEVK